MVTNKKLSSENWSGLTSYRFVCASPQQALTTSQVPNLALLTASPGFNCSPPDKGSNKKRKIRLLAGS